MTSKICTKCNIEKPLTEFSSDTSHQDGYRSQCKCCVANRVAAWREEHPELVKARSKASRAKFHDERIERDRKYYTEHGDKQKAQKREYYQEHRAEILKRNNDWAKSNPEAKKAVNHRRRAREMGNEGSYTADDIERQRKAQRGKCYYCGKKGKLTIDHIIPLVRGGTNWPYNIVLACPRCNSGKGGKLPHEWPDGGRLL